VISSAVQAHNDKQHSALPSASEAPDVASEAVQDRVRQARADLGSLDPLRRKAAYAALRALVPSEFEAESSDGDAESSRVLRVFVYDLATPGIVLLDRYHQALAFARSGLVLAVQTRAPSALVDFSCDGRGVGFDPRDSSRAALGAVLTAGWGVAPSFQRWTPALNDTEHDFLFTTSHTPFGYFSSSKTLSFAIRDSAARHVILSELHGSMVQLASLLPQLQTRLSDPRRPGRSSSALLDEHLYASPSLDFVRRWNVLSYQQERAAHWLSVNQLAQGWLYAQAAAHDARQLAELLRAELQWLTVTLACGREDHAAHSSDFDLAVFVKFSVTMSLCFALLLVGAVAFRQPDAVLSHIVPMRVAKMIGLQGLMRNQNKLK
jgi:hypothetical protein